MFRIIDWIERLCERIYYGPVDIEGLEYLSQPIQLPREVASLTDDLLRDCQKKERLLEELRNAEWILNYEKRLAALQKKTAAQRSKAAQAGTNAEQLRRLEHHLAELRRSLD
jgi:hypothetical protein